MTHGRCIVLVFIQSLLFSFLPPLSAAELCVCERMSPCVLAWVRLRTGVFAVPTAAPSAVPTVSPTSAAAVRIESILSMVCQSRDSLYDAAVRTATPCFTLTAAPTAQAQTVLAAMSKISEISERLPSVRPSAVPMIFCPVLVASSLGQSVMQAKGEAEEAKPYAEGEAEEAKMYAEGEAEEAKTYAEGEAKETKNRAKGAMTCAALFSAVPSAAP